MTIARPVTRWHIARAAARGAYDKARRAHRGRAAASAALQAATTATLRAEVKALRRARPAEAATEPDLFAKDPT